MKSIRDAIKAGEADRAILKEQQKKAEEEAQLVENARISTEADLIIKEMGDGEVLFDLIRRAVAKGKKELRLYEGLRLPSGKWFPSNHSLALAFSHFGVESCYFDSIGFDADGNHRVVPDYVVVRWTN